MLTPSPPRLVTLPERRTAGTGESHAGKGCCRAGPPRPPFSPCLSPAGRPILGPPGRRAGGGGCPGAAPASPGAGSWLGGLGGPHVMKALAARCAVAHPVLGSLFIAGGAARRSGPAALSAGGTASRLFAPLRRCRLICTLAFTSRNGQSENRTEHRKAAKPPGPPPHHPFFLSQGCTH